MLTRALSRLADDQVGFEWTSHLSTLDRCSRRSSRVPLHSFQLERDSSVEQCATKRDEIRRREQFTSQVSAMRVIGEELCRH
jgi:hypothetical protein